MNTEKKEENAYDDDDDDDERDLLLLDPSAPLDISNAQLNITEEFESALSKPPESPFQVITSEPSTSAQILISFLQVRRKHSFKHGNPGSCIIL